MEDWPTRLRRLRNATRLSQVKVAKVLGISGPSIAQWEIGRSKPSLDRLPLLAELYGVTLEELCGTDLGDPQSARRAALEGSGKVSDEGDFGMKSRISGYVGAADRVIIYDHDNLEEETVSLPFFNYPGHVLRVRGESMLPRYKPGELIGIRLPGRECPSAKMLGQDVVAKLANEQMVLKTVVSGPAPDAYTLLSVNPLVPPIYDAPIEWIAPIDFHLPTSW